MAYTKPTPAVVVRQLGNGPWAVVDRRDYSGDRWHHLNADKVDADTFAAALNDWIARGSPTDGTRPVNIDRYGTVLCAA